MIIHAVTAIDTPAAVEAGVTTPVHTPGDGEMSEEQTRFIAAAGIPVISNLDVFVPFFLEQRSSVPGRQTVSLGMLAVPVLAEQRFREGIETHSPADRRLEMSSPRGIIIAMGMDSIGQWFGASVRNSRLALQRCLDVIRDVARAMNAGELKLTNRPDHLLSSANIRRGQFRIERMDEHAYVKSVFLDASRRGEFHSKGFGVWNVRMEDLPELARSIEGLVEAELCIISHPGYCGSTLMANMLEALPGFFVYREPVVWRRLTDLIYEPDLENRYNQQQLDDICLAVFRLFSRTWSPHQRAVVKSIPGGMGLDFFAFTLVPSIRYVYLRPRLEAYLACLFRSDGPRFRWIDDQLTHEWLWLDSDERHLRKELNRFPRHCRAALHWHLHGASMARFASTHPGIVLAIESREFFHDKADVISKVAAHFGRLAGKDEIEELLRTGVASYHAKVRTRRYDDTDRRREEASLLAAHRREIEEAVSWLRALGKVDRN